VDRDALLRSFPLKAEPSLVGTVFLCSVPAFPPTSAFALCVPPDPTAPQLAKRP